MVKEVKRGRAEKAVREVIRIRRVNLARRAVSRKLSLEGRNIKWRKWNKSTETKTSKKKKWKWSCLELRNLLKRSHRLLWLRSQLSSKKRKSGNESQSLQIQNKNRQQKRLLWRKCLIQQGLFRSWLGSPRLKTLYSTPYLCVHLTVRLSIISIRWSSNLARWEEEKVNNY